MPHYKLGGCFTARFSRQEKELRLTAGMTYNVGSKKLQAWRNARPADQARCLAKETARDSVRLA